MAEPASSQASSGAAPSAKSPASSSGGGDPGGGQVFNAQEAFKSTHGELMSTKSQLDRITQEFGGLKKKADGDSKVLEKIKEVFAPTPATPDPIAEAESQLDYYLAQAWEAEKAGNPIPLTTNLAAQFFQEKIARHKEKVEAEKTIKDLKAMVERLADPQRTIDHQAYGNFDNFLKQGLDSLYGKGKEANGQKSAQFRALSHQIAEKINELRNDAPQQWDELRRRPDLQRQVVNHFLKQNLPPQAVKLIEEENLQNTPMKESELWAAFREAGDIKDPEQRREVRAAIRQDILKIMVNRKNPRHQER